MSNLFGMGSGQPVATQATRYNGMQVQASQYGMGLRIVYGQQRLAGTLIWYGDFQSVEHQQSVGKGGGGTSTSYTYSSSFQLAICEGPVASLATIWKDSGTTTLGDINGTFSAGASGQAAWSHLSGADALQYSNTAWIGCVNLALGSSPNVPNFNFEIAGLLQYGSGIVDADPSAIFSDLLTSTTHGLGFQFLGSLTQYHDYCVANNIFLSLIVDQQTTMNEILTRLLQITNSNTAWSNGQLTVIPYGDQSATANGVTYTPATTVQKYFQDSDYVKPVKVDRKPLADLYNVIRVEYVNRSNNYNTSVAEAKDQADIDATFAIRQQEMIQGHAITNATLAQQIAQTLLQRALYIRNTYTFTTTMENVAFEPGDVIALSDSQAELVNEPVRIKSISEQGDNELQFVCEEFPAGVATGATQSVEPPAGYVPSVNGAPDATQPAVIFRGPQFLTDGTPEVWIGVGGAGPNWGGANVLVSLDNVSYMKVGTVSPGCRYGTLTAALATSATDPDTTNSFSVALDAGGTLSGGTDAEADNLATLMLVDTELLAYSSTTLNGDGTYTLGNGYMRRGCYQTTIGAHSIGAPWIRVDDSVFRWQIDPSWVGQTIYIKIQPWNLYGGGLVSESSITPITYVVGTAEEIPDTPPTPTGLTATPAANGVLLTWVTPNPAAVAITSVEYSTNGTTWNLLGQTQGTHYTHAFNGNATYYYRVRARSPAVIWSAYTSAVSSAGGSIDHVSDGSTFARLLASHSVNNVAYNFQGIWSSTTAYVKGDEVIEGQTYWVATANNTASTPSPSNANWQSVGSYAAYQGAWVSTTTFVPGDEVTYNGNFWICVTGNTNSAPTTSNANWVIAGPASLDHVSDGTTFNRTLATALTSGQVDFSKAGVINRYRGNLSTGFDGTNVVENPDFNGGSSAGWSLSGVASVIAAASAPSGCPSAYCLKLPTQNSTHTDCYAGTGVGSYMRVHPGQSVRLSLMYATDSAFNGSVAAGIQWLEGDGVTTISWTHNAPTSNAASQAWTTVEWYETAPSNAVYARPWLTNFGAASGAGAWYATLFRAGGMTGRADTTKGDLSPRGTIPPGASTVAISYSATTTSIEVLWAAGTIYRMDGTSVAVSSGNQTVTGLTAGTVYNFGVYYDEIAGAMKLLTGGSGAVGSPLAAYTSQSAVNTAAIYGQSHAPFGWYQFATPASGTGGGGGSGGCCLRGDQPIELADGRRIAAATLRHGDILTSPDGTTPIVQLRMEPWHEWFLVTLSDRTTLRLAGDHRFVDPAGDQIRARDLHLQQIVESAHGPLAVVGLEADWRDETKVSIEVAEPHVYYVAGVLSHNKVLC